MMFASDRLRAIGGRIRRVPTPIADLIPALDEAATEAEALRADNEALQVENSNMRLECDRLQATEIDAAEVADDEQQIDLAALRAEVERLRAALKAERAIKAIDCEMSEACCQCQALRALLDWRNREPPHCPTCDCKGEGT
jgi:hypothetical protein